MKASPPGLQGPSEMGRSATGHQRRPSPLCAGQQSIRRQCAVDGIGTCEILRIYVVFVISVNPGARILKTRG
jgi:hypothetical protein